MCWLNCEREGHYKCRQIAPHSARTAVTSTERRTMATPGRADVDMLANMLPTSVMVSTSACQSTAAPSRSILRSTARRTAVMALQA